MLETLYDVIKASKSNYIGRPPGEPSRFFLLKEFRFGDDVESQITGLRS